MPKQAAKKKPAATAKTTKAAKTAKTTSKPKALSKADQLGLYEDMLLIRRFEEKAGQLYGMGLIGGFCHLYIGQEAVVVGLQSCITGDDAVITSYRDHAHMLACGMEPGGIMAELTGRIDGFSKGKGGSMHMFSTEKNFWGGHGIVAAQVPFNMASLWKLPVIFVIENNEYAMGTSVKRSHSTTELYKRGESFGIPGKQVDGMDVLAVREAGQEAVEYVKSGNGPMILELKTYRYRGHSMSDPAKYRSKEEVQDYKENHDPIEQFKQRLIKEKIAKEDEFKPIDKKVKEIAAKAAEFAKESPEPPESELWTDVVSD